MTSRNRLRKAGQSDIGCSDGEAIGSRIKGGYSGGNRLIPPERFYRRRCCGSLMCGSSREKCDVLGGWEMRLAKYWVARSFACLCTLVAKNRTKLGVQGVGVMRRTYWWWGARGSWSSSIIRIHRHYNRTKAYNQSKRGQGMDPSTNMARVFQSYICTYNVNFTMRKINHAYKWPTPWYNQLAISWLNSPLRQTR